MWTLMRRKMNATRIFKPDVNIYSCDIEENNFFALIKKKQKKDVHSLHRHFGGQELSLATFRYFPCFIAAHRAFIFIAGSVRALSAWPPFLIVK